MTAQQLELPIASAPRGPTAKDGTHGPGPFEALRGEIESGAQTLNLGPGRLIWPPRSRRSNPIWTTISVSR